LASANIAGGVLAIVVGIFGCLTIKFRNCFVTCPFMTLAFLISALCIIAGAIIISPQTTETIYTATCQTKDPIRGNTGADFSRMVYGFMVEKTMCSDVCPCTLEV
jgi:hypothetical protein